MSAEEAVLYGIGVGPGDPDLLTLKALKVLKAADVIVCPAKGGKPGIAYEIACQADPDLAEKEILPLDFPMVKEKQTLAHREAADRITALLQAGKSVVFLTLGDPCMYSTFTYVAAIIKERGFPVRIISGVTSFCAAAAKVQIPLAEGEEPVMITAGEYRDFDGTLIIMKAGKNLKKLKEEIKACGKKACLAENCGMAGERIYSDLEAMPDEAGYFSILLVKP